MVVSQVNSFRYCYAASRLLLRLQGKSESEINQIEEQLAEGWDDSRVEVALRFARRIGRADPLPNEGDREQVRAAGFREDEVKELAYVAAFTAFWFRRHAGPGKPCDAEPSTDMPYAYLSRPYSGTPIGIKLSQTLRDAWTSRILTTRCKALLFAVVATALGCPHSIAEATRLLRDEGMADADIDELLSHLQCEGLERRAK